MTCGTPLDWRRMLPINYTSMFVVQVNMWSLGQPGTTGQQVGVHDAAVKTIRFIPELNLVASASWSVSQSVSQLVEKLSFYATSAGVHDTALGWLVSGMFTSRFRGSACSRDGSRGEKLGCKFSKQGRASHCSPGGLVIVSCCQRLDSLCLQSGGLQKGYGASTTRMCHIASFSGTTFFPSFQGPCFSVTGTRNTRTLVRRTERRKACRPCAVSASQHTRRCSSLFVFCAFFGRSMPQGQNRQILGHSDVDARGRGEPLREGLLHGHQGSHDGGSHCRPKGWSSFFCFFF